VSEAVLDSELQVELRTGSVHHHRYCVSVGNILLRWTVWVGVISLLASTALQFLGYMKTAMKIDFFGIPLLFLALTTYGIGMLLGKSKQKSNRDAASFRKPPD